MKRKRIHDGIAILCVVVFTAVQLADQITWVHGSGPQPGHYHWFGFRLSWTSERVRTVHNLVGPIGAVAGLTFAHWLFKTNPRSWRRIKVLFTRRRIGKCRGCGYDLRGTPGRCPECGRSNFEGNGPPFSL